MGRRAGWWWKWVGMGAVLLVMGTLLAEEGKRGSPDAIVEISAQHSEISLSDSVEQKPTDEGSGSKANQMMAYELVRDAIQNHPRPEVSDWLKMLLDSERVFLAFTETDARATTSAFWTPDGGEAILNFNPSTTIESSRHTIEGVILHETVHVWQSLSGQYPIRPDADASRSALRQRFEQEAAAYLEQCLYGKEIGDMTLHPICEFYEDAGERSLRYGVVQIMTKRSNEFLPYLAALYAFAAQPATIP